MPKPWLLILFCFLISPLVFCSNIEAKKSSPLDIKSALNNSNNLILATGIFDPKYDSLDFSAQNLVDTTLFNYGIVQFENLAADYDWLNEQGFNVVQSLSGNAYLVNWSHADKHLLEQNPNIRWFGPYKSGYKVSPLLWKSNRPNSLDFVFSISGFKDVINQDYKALISKYLPYAAIVNTNQPKNSGEITVSIKANKVDEALNVLSSLESIQWIAPYQAEKFFNTEAVSAIQASSASGGNNNNYVPINTPIWDQGLYGSGQILGIADSGLDRNEDWFVNLDKGSGVTRIITNAEDVTPPTLGTTYPNNKVFAYWTMPGAEAYDNGTFHGTHTTGSMAGDRSLSIDSGPAASVSSPTSSGYDNDDGMAPNAQILFNDIGSPSGLTGVGSKPMWQQAFAAGAAIHSNSYGASTLGSYVSSDSRADETLRELDDMIILFAAGNDDGQVNSTSSPGNAKNVTTVGALLHGNSSSVASFSNKGPTDDGRLKPDISATGTSIGSAAGNSNNSGGLGSITNPERILNSGTSMSTPITAGAVALLRQYFTDGFFPSGMTNADDKHTPSGTLMKALLLNGTNTDGGFFANNIGWGRVWLANSLHFIGNTKRFRFWEITNSNGLKTNEQFSVSLPINSGTEFRATLVWYDLPGPVGSGVTLVNNLDLSVTAAGNTYLANNFSAKNSVTGGSADSVNTVEQVRFSSPSSGVYTITVKANNIPGDGSFNSNRQGFALVVSGDLSESSNVPNNPTAPTSLQAITNVDDNVSLSWSDVSADYDSYEIYRVEGSCASSDLTTMRYVGQSNSNSFIDTSTIGGFTYSYKVRAFSGDLISSYTNCADVVSTNVCNLPPSFDSASTQIVSNTGSGCQIQLQWQNATSNCPASTTVNYNVYRSTNHNFTASNGTLLATVPSNQYLDNVAILANTPYYYIVKAEDTTTNGEGPNNGNLSVGSYEIFSSALGLQTSEGQLIDDVDNLAIMRVDDVWSVSNERASNGSLSYRSTQEGNTTYTSNTCGRMYSQEFSIAANPANNATIAYKTRYDIEADWDGVVVEISNDGGNSWSDLPPVGGYPNDFSSTGNPPINVCGYPQSQGAFNGSTNGLFQNITHNLSAYHGQTVQIRWSFSSDPGSEEEGFYLDELSYNNILVPQSCTIQNDLIFLNGFE